MVLLGPDWRGPVAIIDASCSREDELVPRNTSESRLQEQVSDVPVNVRRRRVRWCCDSQQ